MTRRRARLLAGALLAISGAASAEAAPVRVALTRPDGAPAAAVAAARVVALRVDGAAETSPGARTSADLASGPLELELPAGLWLLRVEAAGFYVPEQALTVRDESLVSLVVPFVLWPAATLRGKVATREAAPPRAVSISFGPAPEAKGERLPPSGTVSCAIAENGFGCAVPAALLDLQLRARGHVSKFLWDVDARPGATVDVGVYELRRGASLVGTVKTDRGVSLGKSARVELVPRQESGSEGDARRRVRSLSASVNDRGFFHVDGVAPGGYWAVAKQERLVSTRREVVILEGAQAELKEPLVLSRPRTLEVRVSPPVDPSGKAWRLRLWALDGSRLSEVGAADVGADGAAALSDLPSGEYALDVLTKEGDAWHHESFDIDARPMPLAIELGAVAVRGTLTYGGRPLAASVVFGHQHGAVAVRLRSDGEGAFQGVLPRDGEWPVSVEAESPRVARTLRAVRVARAEGASAARVTLALPETALAGRVVDEAGEPQAAIVTVTASDGEVTQERVGPTGLFEIGGLPPGPTALRAEARGDRFSDGVEVTLEEARDGGGAPVTLVLREGMRLRGQVGSSLGPIPGAEVVVVPVPTPPGAVTVPLVTDVRGRFSELLPAGTREVLVGIHAAGFALRLLRTAVPKERPLPIFLDQSGGEVALDVPAPAPGETLVLATPALTAPFFQVVPSTARELRLQAGRLAIRVPSVEPGPLSVCVAGSSAGAASAAGAPGRCANGVVTPHGRLELRVDAAGAPRPRP